VPALPALLAVLPLIGVGPYGPSVHLTQRIGTSAGGRAIMATESGAPQAPRTYDMWLVPTPNPDGRAGVTRHVNAILALVR
jgi:hypothetical protein